MCHKKFLQLKIGWGLGFFARFLEGSYNHKLSTAVDERYRLEECPIDFLGLHYNKQNAQCNRIINLLDLEADYDIISGLFRSVTTKH